VDLQPQLVCKEAKQRLETVSAGTDEPLANLHLMLASGHINFRNFTYVP
jgi:hypothetical protein